MLAFPSPLYYNMPAPAGMMELVDVVDSKSYAPVDTGQPKTLDFS